MSVLHLVCGMAGAGKSALARQLQPSLRAVRLRPSDWMAVLASDPDNRAEIDQLRRPVEALQWRLARELLGLGNNVLLQNGFWLRAERLARLDEAHAIGAKVVLHYLDVPRDELVRSVQQRNTERPPGWFTIGPAELDTWLRSFEAPDEVELARYDDYRVYGNSPEAPA